MINLHEGNFRQNALKLSNKLTLFPDDVKLPTELLTKIKDDLHRASEIDLRWRNDNCAPSFELYAVYHCGGGITGGEEVVAVFLTEEEAEDFIEREDDFDRCFVRYMEARA